MNKEALNAKIVAVNRVNAEANRLHTLLTEAFAPYVSEKILKADGSLLAKYSNLHIVLSRLPNSNSLRVFRHLSDYSLAWTVKACESLPLSGGCIYHEQTIYIADLRGQYLEKLSAYHGPLRTDFTADEIVGRREIYSAAKEWASKCLGELAPFGEYDF